MASTLPNATQSECCPAPCDEVQSIQVPGPIGLSGEDGLDGADGTSPFTTFTALFTIPAELGTSVATVGDTSWMVISQKLYGSRIDGSVHASFEVVAIGGATSVTLRNLEDTASNAYTDNSAPGSTLTAGSKLLPAGIQGPSGSLTGAIPAGSQLKGNYNGAGPQLEIPNLLGALVVGNGTDAVELSAGTDGHMLAYDSLDTEGIKSFKALPLTADTDVADNRIPRLDRPLGTEVPSPIQSSRVTVTDTGAIRADGSGGNARGTDAVDLQVARSAVGMVASGARSVICGGENNTASSTESFVGGGDSNAASTGDRASIVGGMSNVATGQESFIGGGQMHTASGTQSTIAGGDANTASGVESFVGGGGSNQATAQQAAVCGGAGNQATNTQAFVGGGTTNVASATNSGILSGQSNAASGQYSSSIGGLSNTASGDFSMASGRSSVADKYGQNSRASGAFAVAGDAQAFELIWRNSTTDAAPTELFLDGASLRAALPASSSWIFSILMVARRSTGTTSIYKSEGQISNVAGTVAVAGVTTTEINDGIGLPATPFVVDADDPNDALRLTVTGVAANTIRYTAHARIVQVIH